MNLLPRGADLTAGMGRWLSTAGVAVLAAPVLPDVTVDLWGNPADPSRNWWLRLCALGVIIVVVASLAFANLHWSARRVRRRGRDPFADVGPAAVLVVSFSLGGEGELPYTHRTGRSGNGLQIPEFFVEGARPSTVVGIVSPQIDRSTVDDVARELEIDGIAFVPVHITEAYEPHAAIAESPKVAEAVAKLGCPGRNILVDITAGTVVMTLVMMRVGAALGARGVYITSTFKDGRRVPNTEHGYEFLPRTVIEAG